MPDAITAVRIAGICRLAEAMTIVDVPSHDPVHLPDMGNPKQGAEFILNEFVASATRFIGHGQGWSGHLLTYGRALLDLHELGYADLARQAETGFELYIRRIRMGPQETDQEHKEHAPSNLVPLQEAYWRKRSGDMNFGHQLKYPYGFYGLLRHVADSALREKALEVAFRIL